MNDAVKGVKTVRQVARWFRSRLGQQVMILGYHRVADSSHDLYGVTVRPSNFAEQMAVLRQEAHPISLTEACVGLQTGCLPRRAVVVTFDDGYTDVLCAARPLLMQHGIPSTVFIVAGSMGEELWWDELARLILSPAVLPEQLQLRIKDRLLTWSLFDPLPLNQSLKRAPTPRRRLLHMLYQELLAQPDACPEALAELRAWSSVDLLDQDDLAIGRVMSPRELVRLIDGGLIEIGSHTMTHPLLTSLSPEAQAVEIRQSKVMLEEIVGRSVVAFSYPHGAVTSVILQLVQEAGYTRAGTSQNDLARPGSNPFLLPRFWPPDWDGETFARWLRWWLHG